MTVRCGCEAEWSPVTGQGVIDRDGCQFAEAVALIREMHDYISWNQSSEELATYEKAEAFLAKVEESK